MLEHIYRECNEHLRFVANKRDQLLVFYGVIVGALVFRMGTNSEAELKWYMYSIFYAMTVSSAYVFIGYMKWHTLYINSCITIQHLMNVERKSFTQSFVNDVYKSICPDTSNRFKYFIKRSETWVFLLFLMFSTSALFLLIDQIPHLEMIEAGTFIATASTYPVVFFVYSFLSYKLDTSSKAMENFKSGSWLLNISSSPPSSVLKSRTSPPVRNDR